MFGEKRKPGYIRDIIASIAVIAFFTVILTENIWMVPDEDYVPTERPWYLQAKAGAGKVVVVDPYIDAMTGVLTITLELAVSFGH